MKTNLRCFLALVFLTVTLFAAKTPPAQTLTGYPDTLQFFKNYFVTGDYVVGGAGLRGTGVNGWATGYININGIPNGAVVVAAFLYWEAIESTTNPSTMNGYFQGYPIVGVTRGTGAPPCWSSGGGTGASNGTKHLRVYRADVAPYLVVNGQYQTNTNTIPNFPGYQVRLQDSGSNGAGTPLTEGASLVIVYRTLTAPLKSVIFYDGSWTLDNATPYMSQTIQWFYGATPGSGTATITHIVGDGQPNFGENLYYLDGAGGNTTTPNPFIGKLGGTWDNPTFQITIPPVSPNGDGYPGPLATEVLPNSANVPCLSWGAVVMSTQVNDRDNDGLLDAWEDAGGYIDAQDGKSWIALPGANKMQRDLYIQIDALTNSGKTSAPMHSHLPRLDALSKIASAFSAKGISVHFDVGGNFQGNNLSYIISNSVAGTALGGNLIDEDSVSCSDGVTQTLCQFPYNVLKIPGIVSWKSGLVYAKDKYFQHGRKDSYHYVLMGHALALPPQTWSVPDGTLTSVMVNSSQQATVTTSTPNGLAGGQRVTLSGAVGDFNLNGTYTINSTSGNSFTITTQGVVAGTYGNFPGTLGYTSAGGAQSDEPNLVLSAGDPISTSGFSDVGGADSLVTLGLWHADDPAGCQANPAIALKAGQVYCSDQVGDTTVQAGTIMHEVGHTLYLTHGGFYLDTSVPGFSGTFGQNCKSNHLSVMNYQFQIRGLPSSTELYDPITMQVPAPSIDYSGQTLKTLSEAELVEQNGLGKDGANLPQYGTRWFGPPSLLDTLIQNTVGGRYATIHCDGTPIAPGEPPAVRLTGITVANGADAPIDWNNNGVFTDTVLNQDINFDGDPSETGIAGFNDWNNLYLTQIGARRNLGEFSNDLGANDIGGGGARPTGGGVALISENSDIISAGAQLLGNGLPLLGSGARPTGGGARPTGGGEEVDFDLANASVDPPQALMATVGTKSITLNWAPPGFGQIRTYNIYRANISKAPISASNLPVLLHSNTGTPLSTTYVDTSVKSNQTYVYFVTAALGAASGKNAGNQSGGSNLVQVFFK